MLTYKKIYNQLNRAGIIDKVLSETNNDKFGVIEGIKYLEYFVGSTTFKGMTYWNEGKARDDKTTARKICVEYAKLKLAETDHRNKEYEYMIKQMNF